MCILTFSTYVLRISTKNGYFQLFQIFLACSDFLDPPKKSFWLCSANFCYVSTVLDLCFGYNRPMLRHCSTYLSTFSTKIVYVSIVLNLCFDCARSIFDCAPPMFRLCSTYVSTMLGLSSDCDRPTFDCARPVFWMCSTSVLTLLDLFFDCARLCLVYARHMFRLCLTCVSIFLTKNGYVMTFLTKFC